MINVKLFLHLIKEVIYNFYMLIVELWLFDSVSCRLIIYILYCLCGIVHHFQLDALLWWYRVMEAVKLTKWFLIVYIPRGKSTFEHNLCVYEYRTRKHAHRFLNFICSDCNIVPSVCLCFIHPNPSGLFHWFWDNFKPSAVPFRVTLKDMSKIYLVSVNKANNVCSFYE